MKLQQTKCKRQGKYTSAISATLKIGITRRRGSFPFQQNRIGVLKCHTYEKHSWCVSTIHIILLCFLATVVLWPEIYFKKMSKVEEKVNSLIFVAKNLWTLTFVKAIFEAVLKVYSRNRYLHDKQPRQNVKIILKAVAVYWFTWASLGLILHLR